MMSCVVAELVGAEEGPEKVVWRGIGDAAGVYHDRWQDVVAHVRCLRHEMCSREPIPKSH